MSYIQVFGVSSDRATVIVDYLDNRPPTDEELLNAVAMFPNSGMVLDLQMGDCWRSYRYQYDLPYALAVTPIDKVMILYHVQDPLDCGDAALLWPPLSSDIIANAIKDALAIDDIAMRFFQKSKDWRKKKGYPEQSGFPVSDGMMIPSYIAEEYKRARDLRIQQTRPHLKLAPPIKAVPRRVALVKG